MRDLVMRIRRREPAQQFQPGLSRRSQNVYWNRAKLSEKAGQTNVRANPIGVIERQLEPAEMLDDWITGGFLKHVELAGLETQELLRSLLLKRP